MAMGKGADVGAYGYGARGYEHYGPEASYGHAGGQSMDMQMSNPWGGSYEGDGCGGHPYGHGQGDYGDNQWGMAEPPGSNYAGMGGKPSAFRGGGPMPMRPKASMPFPRGAQEELGDLRSRVRMLTQQLQEVQSAKGSGAPRQPKGKGAGPTWQSWEAGGEQRFGGGKSQGKAQGKGKAGGKFQGKPEPGSFNGDELDEDAAEFQRLEEQRQRYGEQLFALVQGVEPRVELTQRITGMLLELPRNELLLNLTSQDELKKRIDEAIEILRSDGITAD